MIKVWLCEDKKGKVVGTGAVNNGTPTGRNFKVLYQLE